VQGKFKTENLGLIPRAPRWQKSKLRHYRLEEVGRTPNMVLAQNVLRDFSGMLKLAKPYGREH